MSWAGKLLVAGAGLIVGLTAIFLAQAELKFGVAAVVVVCLAAGILGSGNPRLFFLYATVLAAPLDFSKRFMTVAHMGGASAIRIDLVDVMLIPIVFYLLRDLRRTRRELYWPAFLGAWVVFAAIGAIFILIGPMRHLAFLEVFRMGKLTLLCLFLVNEVVRHRQIQHLACAMMWSVVLQSVIGIAEYVKGAPLGLYVLGEATPEVIEYLSAATLDDGAFVYRISALLGHSNLFSIFLASQLPIALALLFTRAGLGLRLISGVALGLGMIALILTLSRTGWVAAVAALSLVLLLSVFHPVTRTRFILGRVGIVVVGIVFGVAFSGKIADRLFRSDAGAVNVRFEWLEVAYAMAMDKPVLGWGLNTFVFQMAPYTRYQTQERLLDIYKENLPVVHNIYALVFAEQGIVGVLGLLAFMVVALGTALRNLKARDDVLYALSIGCVAAILVYFIDWVASFSLRMDFMGRTFFLVLAMVGAIRLWRRNNEVGTKGDSTWERR